MQVLSVNDRLAAALDCAFRNEDLVKDTVNLTIEVPRNA
jgi:hypothetical protein